MNWFIEGSSRYHGHESGRQEPLSDMTTSTPHPSPAQLPAYRSGAAARLAGIPVETLRVWERRYKVVAPRMSAGGQRLYSSAEVRRLTLIRDLVDRGHPISAVASLEDAALHAMRAESRALGQSAPARAGHAPVRAVLVGPSLTSERTVGLLSGAGLQIVATLSSLGQGGTDESSESCVTRADALLVELATVQDSDSDRIAMARSACAAAHAVVFYRFATSTALRRLRLAGFTVTRMTSEARQLEAICHSLIRRLTQTARGIEEPAPPRFDEATLGSLADAVRSIACECPRHLVDLIMNLAAFERYSAECALSSPGDQALHLDLKRSAGRARALIEEALERVAAAEGVELPADPPALPKPPRE